MKLRYSPTSPFVRKVVVVAIETGLDARIERVTANPMNPEDVRRSPNPLGKVPVLETDDGLLLYDSPVIVDYLDRLHDGARMIPEDGPARWHALRRQALGDGMLEALVLRFVESLRKPERQSKGWMAHQMAAVTRALDALEREAGALAGVLDIGTITTAVALSFYDVNHPDPGWRDTRPALAGWFAGFDSRPSMRATVLVDARTYQG